MNISTFQKVLVGALIAAWVSVASADTAAVFRFGLPEEDGALIGALASELKAAGYAVTEIDAAALCDPARLKADAFDLLLLPDSASLPARSTGSIETYLKGGGDLIALRTPMWQRAMIRVDGKWLTRDECARLGAGELPANVLFDFGGADLSGWKQASNRPDRAGAYETSDDGPAPGRRALHAVVADLDGWDSLASPDLAGPFPARHTLTVFSARGGPNTTQLAVEWVEKDGSRWIAVVGLTQEWRQYVLAPESFAYWHSVPTRGQRGDQLKPDNAVRISFGLAFSHTGTVGGRHEFWIGPVGTAEKTARYAELVDAFAPPRLDTLSPTYKLFDCTGVAELREDATKRILPVPKGVRSPHPRPGGGGFDKGRAWRWIPLIEARTVDGQWRGTPATMTVHADGPFQGGVWASFGVADGDWYKSPEVLRCIRDVAERMRRGAFLLDGGSNFYTYFEDQAITLGARVAVVNGGREGELTARVTVLDHGTGNEVVAKEWPVTVRPGEVATVSETWKPPPLLTEQWHTGTADTAVAHNGFEVVAELLVGEEVVDRVAHEAYVWRPKKEKHFITVENGEFMLEGKRWRAHGVNYMPSSGIGTEDSSYFEYWLGARSYDPEVIDRDLRRIRDMGLNAVSIFMYHESVNAQNLLDLLRRLDGLGLKANLSLRPGTPLDFRWPQMRDIIEYYRLREHDTVFALDLAWEPMFGTHDDRKLWDRDWEKWIVERYGSLADAEKDWEFVVPKDEAGAVTNPLPPHIDTDGTWRRMTAAYRRFLDTLLYKKYGAARRLVRGVDPHHLVSFRMAEAGNPNYRWDGRIPYDFACLAGAVDLLEPEAYGRIGDWEKVKPGWFEYEYARWAAPDKPMIWAEAGVSTWDISRMVNSPARLEFQAELYRHLYRMFIGSGADGVFFWWYPGGFRVGEDSDYGIIDPDGSDRPVTKVIREHAAPFLNGPPARPVDFWIEFDRDAHPDGLAGIYDEAKDDFWQSMADGHVPGLRTAGTGTNSATCLPLAVGNVPWNGRNPPKYLDGAFDVVEVRNDRGEWENVAPGGSVRVAGDRPAAARVTVTNLGEAEWVAPAAVAEGDGAGGVHLVIEGAETHKAALPASVQRFGSVTLEEIPLAGQGKIVLTLEADRRTRFGERFAFALQPVQAPGPATTRTAEGVRVVPIAKGWARNTVNAVIFRQHAVTTFGDTQYTAFYDPGGNLVLARRKLGSDKWETRTTQYEGNVRDAHNAISIAVDGTGTLHVAWDHHGNPLHYARGVRPAALELGDRVPMTGKDEDRVTYPEFFNLSDGGLLFMYRAGGSGKGNTMLNRYDAKTQTWTVVQHPLIDGEGRRNAYTNQLAINGWGVWHLSWTWRESGDVSTNHDVCYAKSADGGRTWTKSNRDPYSLPITLAGAEVVKAIPQNSNLINQCTMAVDAQGRPMIATYWQAEGQEAVQYHLVWFDGSAWYTSQVTRRTTGFDLRGGGSKRIPISRPKLAVDPRGRVYMFFRDAERGGGVSVAVCDAPDRAKWDILDLTSEPVGMWEPNYDTVLWQRDGIFHLFTQFVGQGDGETLEDVPPQMVSILEWRP